MGYAGFADGRQVEVTWEKWKINDSLVASTLVGEFLFEAALSSESLVVEMRVGWDSRELKFNTLEAREVLEQLKLDCPLL